MLPDRVSNPGPLTYESGALPIALRGPATRFLINQCQVITFLILKYDIIENSRIELRGIVLPVQVGGLLGEPKGMLALHSEIIGGGGLAPLAPPPPLPTPMFQ